MEQIGGSWLRLLAQHKGGSAPASFVLLVLDKNRNFQSPPPCKSREFLSKESGRQIIQSSRVRGATFFRSRLGGTLSIASWKLTHH
jgi:hypothetical protein